MVTPLYNCEKNAIIFNIQIYGISKYSANLSLKKERYHRDLSFCLRWIVPLFLSKHIRKILLSFCIFIRCALVSSLNLCIFQKMFMLSEWFSLVDSKLKTQWGRMFCLSCRLPDSDGYEGYYTAHLNQSCQKQNDLIFIWSSTESRSLTLETSLDMPILYRIHQL